MTHSFKRILYLLIIFGLIKFGDNVGVSRRRTDQTPASRSDLVVFPGESQQTNEIPLDMLQKLNDITNISYFLTNFIEPTPLALRISGASYDLIDDRVDSLERKAVKDPEVAKCMPELQTVQLGTTDSKKFYFPSCTRVQRCGGCCSTNLLSCQPTEVEIIHYRVVVTEYTGGRLMKYKGREIIPVEQHLQCKCDCRLKEKDCNPFQQYNRARCNCVCANTDAESKCYEQGDTKLWDSNQCACVCRNEQDCSNGYYFDKFTCMCTPARDNKRTQNRKGVDRLTYNLQRP